MKISEINKNYSLQFKETKTKPKREFIDIIADNVRNPRDVNDCVAVPRGIFKAYWFYGKSNRLFKQSCKHALSFVQKNGAFRA